MKKHPLMSKEISNQSPFKLSDEQSRILKLSDEEIESGNLIPDDEVSKNDLKWLKEFEKI
jgi:hypothetical protein